MKWKAYLDWRKPGFWIALMVGASIGFAILGPFLWPDLGFCDLNITPSGDC